MAVVLSVLPRLTTSDYPFGILWPLYVLSFLDLRLLITLLVSCCHCIVCHSSILYCLSFLDFVLSVIPRFTTSDYPFGILWPLYCLSFLDFVLSIIPRFCIVSPSSIYDFWLPLWYLVAIVLSVLPRFCIICHSSIYDFWLPLWYLVAIVLSVLPRFTTYDYHFGILWPLYCLSVLDLRLLITPLVSCGHCIVCPSSIYDLWLPLWYLKAIVLSVLPQFTTSDYPFGIMWPLYFLSFLVLRFLITPLVSCGLYIIFPSSISDFWLPLWYLVAIALSVLPRFTTSDYPFGILWPLYCLSFLDLRLMITSLVSYGHCIFCPSSIYDFWLPLWYLVAIALSVLPRFTTSDYPFGILWPLYFRSFLDLRFLITPLVSCGHCIVCPSSINDFWLPLWYHVVIVLSVIPRFTISDYPFGVLWPLYCLSLLDLRLLITPLVSFGHCIVCPSSIYDFWLLLWYLVAIVLSVLPRFTTFDYPFGILWPLYCLSFFDFVFSVIPRFTTYDYPFRILWPLYCLSFLDLRLLITPLVSCGRFIVCPSSINDFWWPLWYLVAIVLSVLPRFTTSYHPFLYLVAIVLSVPPRFTTSDYPFCILWPLYCLFLLDLRLLITPLVSCGRWIFCPSSINDFWLPLWYLVAIVFSVLPRLTTSDYPFGILWPLYCLSFLD